MQSTSSYTHTGHQPPKPLRFLERVEKPVPRPPTPCVASPTDEEEECELAVVLLQRVLRGRAIQAKVRHAHHTITLTKTHTLRQSCFPYSCDCYSEHEVLI